MTQDTETETETPEPLSEPVTPETVIDEETEEEEAHEAETPPEEPAAPAEAQGMTPEEWEKRFNQSDKAFDAYVRRIGVIWGDDAPDLLPVAVSPSAPPGFLNKHDAGRVPDDIQTPILEFFGLAREQEYEPDPMTATCATCKGKTKTKTGSGDPQFATRTCPTCKGWGYTISGRAPSDAQTPTNGEVASVAETVGPLVTDERDAWGEPRVLPDGRVNPNYGKMPQFKEPIAPWGVTANLTAQDAAG